MDRNYAFKSLKEQFKEEKALQIFDLKKLITIEIDTSDKAIRACLLQPNKSGKLQLVAFYSRKFILVELNYDIYNKELIVIVNAFETQKVYLEGAKYKVEIIIDYKNLLAFTTIKVLN